MMLNRGKTNEVTKDQDFYTFLSSWSEKRVIPPSPLLVLIILFLIFVSPVFGATSSVGNNNAGTVTQSSADATGGSSTATTGAITNNNTSSGGSASGGSSNLSMKTKAYTAPSLAAAQGTDTLQLGSLVFGSIGISRDAKSVELVRNMNAVKEMYEAGLVTEEEAREFVGDTIKELKKIRRKCLGFVPCGRERKIWNLFGLI